MRGDAGEPPARRRALLLALGRESGRVHAGAFRRRCLGRWLRRID
jgi:hypothetical protein